MSRVCTIAFALGVAACDPTTVPGTGTGTGSTPVQYNAGPCDAIAPSATSPGTDLDAPATFAVGEVVEARIDPDSTGNFRHYWDVPVDAGVYHLVVDTETADGGDDNIGLNIEQLDGAGIEVGRLIRGNEIDHRVRLHTVVTVEAATTLRLEVEPLFEMEDYQLGLFENAALVPSPFFVDCPATTVLELDTPLEVTLGEDDLGDTDEVWLTFDAAPGDYRFTVDADQVGGTSTNLIYTMDAHDRFGQVERVEQILFVNEIDISFRDAGTLNVGEATSFWLRLNNGQDALDLSITVTEE